MKKRFLIPLFSAILLTVSAADLLPPEIKVTRTGDVRNLKIDSPLWKNTPSFPLITQANQPGDLNRLPIEKGCVRLLSDGRTLCIKADLSDSELLCEDTPGKPVINTSDVLLLILSPLSETGYFNILITPPGKVFCSYVLGGGSANLAIANLTIKTPLRVQTSLQGNLNDLKKDTSWHVFAALPLDKLAEELAAQGLKIDQTAGWSLMIARRNYSSMLETPENSGFPQPVRNFYSCRSIHARLK